jgi:hypothetical protein
MLEEQTRTDRPILRDGAIRQLRGIMRSARLNLSEIAVHLARLDGAGPGRVAARLGVAEGQVRAWLDRGIEKLQPHRNQVYEVLLQEAAAVLGALRNSGGHGHPEPAVDHRGRSVELRARRPAPDDLAQPWLRYVYGEGEN